MMYFIRRLHCG